MGVVFVADRRSTIGEPDVLRSNRVSAGPVLALGGGIVQLLAANENRVYLRIHNPTQTVITVSVPANPPADTTAVLIARLGPGDTFEMRKGANLWKGLVNNSLVADAIGLGGWVEYWEAYGY